MSLKQLIKERKILESGAVQAELVLPGEPMIYSIKYNVAKRWDSLQFYRNRQYYSLLKCYFKSYHKTNTPVVVLVRFYVTPPKTVKIKANEVKKEKTPAVFSYELCDYLLSFLEMLNKSLVNSYRQFVKIDCEKFYSANPRTVLQFMSWSHYVYLQNRNSLHAGDKSFNPASPKGVL